MPKLPPQAPRPLSKPDQRLVRAWTTGYRATVIGHTVTMLFLLALSALLITYTTSFITEMLEAGDRFGLRMEEMLTMYRVGTERGLAEWQWAVAQPLMKAGVAGALSLTTLLAASAHQRRFRQGRAFHRAWLLENRSGEAEPGTPPQDT